MEIVISNDNEANYNLALEELILKNKNLKDEVLFIYQNKNACIFGRNQNIHEEINEKYVNDNKINLVRRISGGGAVYQDLGNVCFSFISENKPGSYQNFLNPIIDFLKSLDLNAQFKGKNDLVIDGYKISGNAQYKYGNRMFHHGTLLFDTDLTILGKALKPSKLKLESKSIKSARQRVSNIRPILKKDLDTNEFIEKLKAFFVESRKVNEFDLSLINDNELKALISVRKSTDWIYGKNPEFNIQNEKRYDGGTIKFSAFIKNNLIKNIEFSGDFLSTNDFEKIYKFFINKSFDLITISKILNSIPDLIDFFGKITKKNILDLMF